MPMSHRNKNHLGESFGYGKFSASRKTQVSGPKEKLKEKIKMAERMMTAFSKEMKQIAGDWK